MYNLLHNIIPNVITAFTITIVLNNLVKITMKRAMFPCFFIINYVVLYFSPTISSYLVLIISILFMTGSLYYSSKDIFNSIIPVLVTFIIISISDLSAGVIIMSIFMYNNATLIRENLYALISLYLVMFIISYILSVLLGKFYSKIRNNNVKKSFGCKVWTTLYIIFTLVIFYLSSMMYKYYTYESNKMLIILNMLLFSFYFFVSVVNTYLYVKCSREQAIYECRLKEIEQFQEHSDMVNSVLNDLNTISNDYKNTLLCMKECIRTKDIDALENLFNKDAISEDRVIINRYKDLDMLKKVKNNEVRGLLVSKIIKAQLLETKILLDIQKDINDILVDTFDLCYIVGIIFDNSIEMASKTEERRINFRIMQNDECTLLVVSNSFELDKPLIHKTSTGDFCKEDKSTGFSIDIVNKIIQERCSNILLNTTTEDGMFKQELVIYKE